MRRPTKGVHLGALLPLVIAVAACRTEVNIVDPDADDGPPPSVRVDQDRDGFTVEEGDCDDDDALRAPGLVELCDAVDNDCDGSTDGGAACGRVDAFEQSLAVDVLIVVDTTVEAELYLSRFVAGSWELGRHLVGPSIDSHIGVATMDVSVGELVSPEGRPVFLVGERVPSAVPQAAEAAFVEWMHDAILARPSEDAPRARDSVLTLFGADIEAADASPQSSIPDGGFTPFRRADVPLVVLFISPRDDASLVTPTAFIAAIAARSDAGPPVFHAIVPMRDGCPDDPKAEVAPGYHALVDLTGGVTSDACMVDYRPFLSVVGQLAAGDGLGTMFRLSATADVERPVHVRVTLPEGYGYDLLPGDFELVDGGDALWLRSPPVAGASIDVTYERLP